MESHGRPNVHSASVPWYFERQHGSQRVDQYSLRRIRLPSDDSSAGTSELGVVGEVAAPRPTPLSLLRELIADSHGFATAMLDVQARMLA